MNEEKLINYYNKFNEKKRLKTRHGEIEFYVTTSYINKYLKKENKIIDIGAGTGAYSNYYEKKGYNITAIELVKHNIREIEKNKNIKCYSLNATNLKGIESNYYDVTLLLGPMYHLLSDKEKEKALSEAKRVTKRNGYIFICYCLKDFAILKHGFIDNHIDEIKDIEKDTITDKDNLYSFVSIDYINKLRKKLNLKEIEMISQEGPTEYFRKEINKMDEKTFNIYKEYILKNSNNKNMLDYSRHIIDITKKTDD